MVAVAALEAPLPPEVPRIVEERQWLSTLGAVAERRTKILGEQYDALATEWLEKMQRVQGSRHQLLDRVATPVELEELSAVIDGTESFADHRARRRAIFSKQGKKKVNRLFELDPSVGAIYRSFYEKLLIIDDRVIEALLDHALFLRAVRADLNPDARGGPTFADPAELRRHLKAALAA